MGRVSSRFLTVAALIAALACVPGLTGADASGQGYWLTDAAGTVHAFGDAPTLSGLPPGVVLNGPILGMVATRSGRGCWLLGSDGGVFSFGDALFHGSTGWIR